MNPTGPLRWSDRMAAIATALAAIASAAGLFVTDLYRDNDAMVAQARGTDLATLFAAVPAAAISLWAARAGSQRGRLVVLGAIGYLVYSYAIYSFQVVISPVTPLHIAILGLAAWSLMLGGIALASVGLSTVGSRLPRRTAGIFLVLIVLLFGGLWLGQIAGAITSGVLPVAVSDLDLPTSAVYALDLAFALPMLALGAGLLLRHHPSGGGVAVACLVFVVLMALSILGLFAVQASEGVAVEASMTVAFALVGGSAALLGALGLLPTGPVRAAGRVAPAAR
jgi:hypothetical protein